MFGEFYPKLEALVEDWIGRSLHYFCLQLLNVMSFQCVLCNSDKKKDHLMVSRKKEDADNGIGALSEQISLL